MYNVGLLSLFLYNVLTSAKGVYLGSFLQKVHPFLVLAICFTLVTIFFAIYNYLVPVNGVSARKVAKAQWKQVVLLNISGLAGWTGFYYALKLIEPAIVTSLTSALGPIVTAIYFSLIRKERTFTRTEWGIFAGLGLIISYLTVESYLGFSAVQKIPVTQVLIGVFAAAVCGVANVANTVLGKSLNNAGLKSRQVIPLRFFLLILTGALLCPTEQWSALSQPVVQLSVLVIGLFGVAVPVLLFQIGIEKTNPFTVASVHATIPIFVLAAQLFDDRLNPSAYSIVGAVLLAMLSMASLVLSSTPQSAPSPLPPSGVKGAPAYARSRS